ncbi:MAG: hypothetical protein HPY50_18765 [Firmicutes bacterium]|nr:hypothetical protein [Bacillota bacterium]
MMLLVILIVGIAIYFLLGSVDRSKKEWRWALGLLGAASVLVSGYNLILLRFIPESYIINGAALYCSGGGGIASSIIGLLVGLTLIAAAIYRSTRGSSGGGSPPNPPDGTTLSGV